MKQLLIVVAMLVLAGCLPSRMGSIEETTSTLDGTRELTMVPAWISPTGNTWSGAAFKIGLYHSSKMDEGNLILIAEVPDIVRIRAIHFNIDGATESLVSFDSLTKINVDPGAMGRKPVAPNNISSNRYFINKAFLGKILSAKDVRVRLELDQESLDGIFSVDTPSTARPAFREFYSRLYGQQ